MSVDKMVEFILGFEQEHIEQEYRDYLGNVRKMNGAGNIQLLSKTCALLDADKCYVEVGTHRGCTLLGAAKNNDHRMFYGVDNFAGHNSPIECAPFATVEEGLQDAISRLAPSGNVKYFKEDYKLFLQKTKAVEGRKVGVYLYDGDHMFEHQYWGLRLAPVLLADDAIVFVDDSANNDRGAVWGAINRIISEDKRFSVIREFIPKEGEMHGDFWCGFVALRFKK
jgi:hypothetical protein